MRLLTNKPYMFLVFRKTIFWLSKFAFLGSVLLVATFGWQVLGKTLYVSVKKDTGQLTKSIPVEALYGQVVSLVFIIFMGMVFMHFVTDKGLWTMLKPVLRRIMQVYSFVGIIAAYDHSLSLELVIVLLIQFVLVSRITFLQDEKLKKEAFPDYGKDQAFTEKEWKVSKQWQNHLLISVYESRRTRETLERFNKETGKWETEWTIPEIILICRVRYTPYRLVIHQGEQKSYEIVEPTAVKREEYTHG
ncbi:hypothetical protein [Enterococcus faecalis]|uniref:hypothetical protein n=1 Tax=Enterococcus faecalis TaxID=1351 RepID=UPI00032DE5FB|nr:hypothetical protein [Enterococcus faecalis]EOK35907.1 hypothetical protein WUI_03168 [Enterococcus faecalis EnGen0335]EOL91590.1 hypothetical protein WM1_03118 [Enterococcus faecalis EnGen0341]